MYDPKKIYEQLIDAGDSWADAKAGYEQLHEVTKSVLASLKKKYQGSNADKTDQALADDEYQEHLKAVASARKDYLLAQVRYDSIKALSDHRRTEQSTRRAEITHLNG